MRAGSCPFPIAMGPRWQPWPCRLGPFCTGLAGRGASPIRRVSLCVASVCRRPRPLPFLLCPKARQQTPRQASTHDPSSGTSQPLSLDPSGHQPEPPAEGAPVQRVRPPSLSGSSSTSREALPALALSGASLSPSSFSSHLPALFCMESRTRSTRASLGFSTVASSSSTAASGQLPEGAGAPPQQQKTPAHAPPPPTGRVPSSLDPLLNPSPSMAGPRWTKSTGSATGDPPAAGSATSGGQSLLLAPSSPIGEGSTATGPQRSTSRSAPLSPPAPESSLRSSAPVVEPLAFGGRRLVLAERGPSSTAAAAGTHLPPFRPTKALPDSQHSSLDTSPLHPHSSSSSTAVDPASSSAATVAGASAPAAVASGSSSGAQAARQQQQVASSSKVPSGKPSSAASTKASGSKRASSASAASSTPAAEPAKKKKKKAPSAEPAPAPDVEPDAGDGSSGVLRAGDLSLEFKTIDGVQMVLGKEGKWFDFVSRLRPIVLVEFGRLTRSLLARTEPRTERHGQG